MFPQSSRQFQNVSHELSSQSEKENKNEYYRSEAVECGKRFEPVIFSRISEIHSGHCHNDHQSPKG